MNLDYLPFKQEQGDNGYSYIWAQAKTLEYMAMSMLQRQRFFSVKTVLGLQLRTFKQCDKMIERVFRIFDKDIRKK